MREIVIIATDLPNKETIVAKTILDIMKECPLTRSRVKKCLNVRQKLGTRNTLSLSHALTFPLSHSITFDMLNNFYFHIYAQNSLFIAENCNGFFLTASSSCEFRVSRAGSQLKNIDIFTYKQRILSIDMKIKVVQHVKRE